MQVNVDKMLFWEHNFAMAFRAAPDDVVRVVAGETSYLGVGLAEVSRVIMADADFDPSEVGDEVLEEIYCVGKWYEKGMGNHPGVVSLRRSILEGRRPYLVVGVRDRTLGHPSGVEMGSGLLRCLEGADDDRVWKGTGGLSSLPAVVSRNDLEVSRFPTWFLDKIMSYLTKLREDMAKETLVNSSIPVVRSSGGDSFMVFVLTGGNASSFLPILLEHGFTALRDVSPTTRHHEVLMKLDRMGDRADRYLNLCRLLGTEPGCAAPMELIVVLTSVPGVRVVRLISSEEPVPQINEVKFTAVLVPVG